MFPTCVCHLRFVCPDIELSPFAPSVSAVQSFGSPFHQAGAVFLVCVRDYEAPLPSLLLTADFVFFFYSSDSEQGTNILKEGTKCEVLE